MSFDSGCLDDNDRCSHGLGNSIHCMLDIADCYSVVWSGTGSVVVFLLFLETVVGYS